MRNTHEPKTRKRNRSAMRRAFWSAASVGLLSGVMVGVVIGGGLRIATSPSNPIDGTTEDIDTTIPLSWEARHITTSDTGNEFTGGATATCSTGTWRSPSTTTANDQTELTIKLDEDYKGPACVALAAPNTPHNDITITLEDEGDVFGIGECLAEEPSDCATKNRAGWTEKSTGVFQKTIEYGTANWTPAGGGGKYHHFVLAISAANLEPGDRAVGGNRTWKLTATASATAATNADYA